MKADLKMNLVSEVDEPLSFDGLIKGFSKLNIDLQDKDVSDFITMDDETTAEYLESILEEVETANNEEDFGEEEEEFEFEGLKPMLMKTINFNAQLCSSKAVAGAGEHYEELKATCEKFQRLLCKASATEEQFKQKKNVK